MTSPYRVEAIALHEIGVFDDLRLDFKPIASPERDAEKAEIHILTGPNGCGKSTVLYAIAEIFKPFNNELSLIASRFRKSKADSYVNFFFQGSDTKYSIHKDKALEPEYKIYEVSGKRFADVSQYPSQPIGFDGLGFDNIGFGKYKIDTAYYGLDNYSMSKFSFACFSYSGRRNLTQTNLGSIQPINTSPFENALSFDYTVRPEIILQWVANNRTQSALAQQDGDFLAAESYDLALSRITSVIKEICDIDVAFRLQRSPLAVTISVNGENINFDVLPDGLKSIISWVADLSLRLEAIPWENPALDIFSQPIILLLDEIDIHLHPKWQRRILPAVQKLLPNSQIFVSTHSPFVVGSVEDAWVYRLPEPRTTTGTLVVEGIPSGAGKSYQLILEEVFGIDEEFDVETEELFAEFYAARTQFLKTPNDAAILIDYAQKISAKGEEAAQIIARELRQISRVTGQELSLA